MSGPFGSPDMGQPADVEPRSLALRVFLRLQPLRRWPFWARYSAVTVIVAVALALRFALDGSMDGAPFLLGFPAVLLSAALFNRWAGAYSALLCTMFWVQIWVTPYGVFVPGPDQLVSVLVFLLASLLVGFVAEALGHSLAELVASEQQLTASLGALASAHKGAEQAEREKDILLKELAHRIRNDLNTLAAMLRMRARATPSAASALAAAADQVQVFGRVHAKLSLTDGDLSVDSQAFLEELGADLEAAHLREKPVQLVVRAERHLVSSKLAATMGLALNELITNAMKHAFGDQGGMITAEFDRAGDKYRLTVEDNGVGLAEKPAYGGLGTGLLKRLAAQFGGEFRRSEVKPRGVRCEVTFEVETPADVIPAR